MKFDALELEQEAKGTEKGAPKYGRVPPDLHPAPARFGAWSEGANSAQVIVVVVIVVVVASFTELSPLLLLLLGCGFLLG